MSKEPLISKEAREAYDEAYQLIRNQKEKERVIEKKQTNPWLISMAVLVVATVVIVGTPVGLAVSKLLGFDKFDSEILTQNNFIVPQNKSVIDKDITVSLVDFYADSHEIGIHLQAELPKNHALLSEKLDTPSMSLSITNEQGEEVIENGIGDKRANLDRESGILDFFYTLSTEESIDSLDKAIVTVYRIGALYKGQKSLSYQSGYHELKGEYVEGDWVLKVDTSTLKKFDTLYFKPNKEELIGAYTLQVSPTKIMIEINNSEWHINETAPYNTPELLAVKGDKEEKLSLESSSSSTKEDGSEVYQLMFDFGGYESYDKFILTMSNQEVVEFIP